MNKRTWTIIGATMAIIGVAILSLGLFQEEQKVRYVEDVLESPATHATGDYTLMGIPQPATVQVMTPAGLETRPNPEYVDYTSHVTPWRQDGQLLHSEIRITVRADQGRSVFMYENITTAPETGNEIDRQTEGWTLPGANVFPVQAFDDGDNYAPMIWAWIPGSVGTGVEVTPSQLTGRLLTTTPDGHALPPGAVIWQADEYAAGCSSKFVPPETQEKYNLTE